MLLLLNRNDLSYAYTNLDIEHVQLNHTQFSSATIEAAKWVVLVDREHGLYKVLKSPLKPIQDVVSPNIEIGHFLLGLTLIDLI